MSDNKQPFTKFQIRWNDKVGRKECPYLTRYTLTLFNYSIRLHYWTASDDQRHLHDHPWWMLIFCLWGSYWDIQENDVRELVSPGTVHYRKAEHKHTVELISKPTITLLLTGPKTRNWGFWVPGRDKILRPLRYFKRYGHHQCDQ